MVVLVSAGRAPVHVVYDEDPQPCSQSSLGDWGGWWWWGSGGCDGSLGLTDLFSTRADVCCENGKRVQTPRATECVPVSAPPSLVYGQPVFFCRAKKKITAA